jgi:putative tryptophan/tyrosine transport system substrate-binding protein
MLEMRRREFITLLGGAVAWPLAADAQQPAMPVIGYLNTASSAQSAALVAVFRQSLSEAGFVEGRNVAIEYRWAEGQYDRLPAMAAELVRRQVAVIVASPIPAAVVAKAATATIPIVFHVASDPVKLGLVAGLDRPGGNATGVNSFLAELGAKQLGLLHDLLPTASRIGLLVNPTNANFEGVAEDVTAAATTIGLQIDVVHASDSQEIETAFATLVRNKADALLIGSDGFFYTRRLQLTILAARHAIPVVYSLREFSEVGGLISYGTSLTESFRKLGVYAGRILKGAKPAEMPVEQPTKFDFVLNLITAKALGITVPEKLVVAADEVIE